ncbi:MAG: hypothetical protein LBI59_02110 [Candidatus Accumulibacter sp.]|jgi:uncharacterized protein YgbK (DUF1537 family)|nr:hypothetical protein [Accumulibacter sp.]
MEKNIRILADDLTGALDTAAAFAGNVPVYLARPPEEDKAANRVSVVATATRDVPADALAALLTPAADWFKSGGLSFKKVDSLLRGNTFAEIAWLFKNLRFTRVIFAPAFPAQGRITVDDRQWRVCAEEDEKRREAVAVPLRAAFAELGLRSGRSFDEPADVWIPEVATDEDLDRVVRQAAPASSGADSLWVGCAGLGNALARHFGLSPKADSGSAVPLAAGPGPAIFVSASFQTVFREQWARLRASRSVPAVAEAGDAARIAAAIGLTRAGAGEAWFDLSPRESIGQEEALNGLKAAAERLAGELPKPGRLIVVGGDTLLALCRATKAEGLLTHPPIRPGWGCARLLGGAWSDAPCFTRSGAFGAADDLVALFGALGYGAS